MFVSSNRQLHGSLREEKIRKTANNPISQKKQRKINNSKQRRKREREN
jgi:hypothetical protein